MVILLSPNMSSLLSAFKRKGTESDGPARPEHVPTNVFSEDRRPKYMEDLHTEAQQGLKELQQYERNGVDFPDDQSIISTMTARTDDDVSFSELVVSESESTAADTISTRSAISYQSSRSGLTRQASTFRPLNQERKHGKSRSKGRHRSTVTGIPRHVQKELGLDRAAWTASQFTDAQLTNGGVIISTVLPTLDSISITSEHRGPIRENLQAVREDEPELTQDGHKDELSLIQHFLPQSLDPQRPRSLAVPWMTSSGSHPPSPVMYVSPEATYLSKIIPNAILPPSVDVVELSRNRSRSSVRMVSKSSLASASPSSTRPSSRASSRMSSRASSRISSRASTLRSGPLSDSSGWSRSGSSETLVSESSTISSSSTPRVTSRASQEEETDGFPTVSIKNSPGAPNPIVTSKPAQINGDPKEEETSGAFNRSLSVIKKSKNPPPPPNRSYSLHGRRHGKPLNGTSADNQRAILEELESKRKLPKTIPKIHYSHTNGSHIHKDSSESVKGITSNGVVSSPAVLALRQLFEIPAPPGVLAPPPPPPETWAHNQRTFELLCGPGPVNFERWAQKRGLKIEPPAKKAPAKMQDVVGTNEMNSKIAGKSFLSETDGDFQKGQTTNRMKDNILQPNKEAKASDMQSSTAMKISNDVQPPYGNSLSILRLAKVHPSPSPSPPPEHLPPLPPVIASSPKENVSSLKAQFRITSDEFIPPPHPMFPPPPPPTNITPLRSPDEKNETDFPPPPPPFSPKTLLNLPPLPQEIPPSPQEIPLAPQIPQPPPTEAPPPPPQVPPPPPQVLPTPSQAPQVPPHIPPSPQPPQPPQHVPPTPQAPHPPAHVPPSPPAPTRLQDAPTPPKTSSCLQGLPTPPKAPIPPQAPPPPPQSSTPTPQEIPCLPQCPPLEASVQAQTTSVEQINIPPPPPLPKDVKKETKPITTDKQEKAQPSQTNNPVPTKEETATPIVTQSLLQMVRLRSVKSNSSQAEAPIGSSKPQNTVGNHEAPPKPIRRSLIMNTPPPEIASLSSADLKKNQGTVQASDEPEVSPEQEKPFESTPLSNTAEQNSLSDQAPQQTESNNEPAEPKTQSEAEPGPEPSIEPKPQTVTNGQNTDTNKKETTEPSKTKDRPSNTVSEEKTEVTLPKLQTVIPTVTAKIPPTGKPPNATASSMRLQEAIRLKAAAMSSNDSQTKRLSITSPRSPAGCSSPSSTANFIFSKSPKKVILETPSSPESQVNLRKTLASELASVSQTIKPADPQNKGLKVPPPVAKKPSSRAENSAHYLETKAESEHVQTAGQQAQPES